MGADVIAADVNCGAWLPILETADMHNQKKLSDLSLKRNIGLAVARMVGWDRVLFLDDDIIDVNPSHIRAAASLLGSHDVVGLKNVGFHDNSVVCHALRRVERSLGMKQDTFVGGGAMAVAVDRGRRVLSQRIQRRLVLHVGSPGAPACLQADRGDRDHGADAL
jgi:hypothetical protein